ncbi:MAG: DUF2252 family protein, partial [Bacteroidia bacterium]
EVKKLPPSPLAWICGDLHLENFGSYKGDNRLVYFDLNDFDEALLAPALLELSRIITSIFIAFASLGIERKKAVNMGKLFLKTYSEVLANGKSIYIEPKTAKGVVATFLTYATQRKKKALLNKRTVKKKNSRRIKITSKHLRLDKTLKQELSDHITNWVIYHSGRPYNYEVTDVVFRVAGLGSLGLKRYLFLLKSTNVNEKYLLVDMKQARNSSVEKLAKKLKVKQPEWATEAERIVFIQQRMQNVAPAMLSATVFKGEEYMIQEMQPSKDGIKLGQIKDNYRHLYQVISDMAILTASAQLRSAGRQGSAICDDLIAFGKRTDWQEFVMSYAKNYNLKVRKDFGIFSRTNH